MKGDVFHTLFVISFLSFVGIRAYYHRRASLEGGRMNVRDTRFSILLRLLLAIPLAGLLVAYMIRPAILGWAEIALPAWASWLGALMVLTSFALLIWVHRALGANFNTVLGVRDRHTLVTHGPYHWVRHPMYGVLFLFMVGLLLLTGNLLIGGLLLAGLVVTVGTRVAKEEAILEEAYGEEYSSYKARTGRFVPRLS
ncbi:MAG TPA: isoprenylcysteine carboxylmethyltransferase family protein [Anaerolineales bacterium]|nr:isoprenylcysteine carboxylmethyltransferase family protein [Anaerolineales bacterium]